MCGIIGYIGNREAASILHSGLKNLEYRGYDSCGIACLNDNTIHIKNESRPIDRKYRNCTYKMGYARLCDEREYPPTSFK